MSRYLLLVSSSDIIIIIIHFMKAQSLRWSGHVERMPEERDVRRIYKWELIASRPVGRPMIRWMNTVMKGIQGVKIVNWKR
jgi:hypothetical protein